MVVMVVVAAVVPTAERQVPRRAPPYFRGSCGPEHVRGRDRRPEYVGMASSEERARASYLLGGASEEGASSRRSMPHCIGNMRSRPSRGLLMRTAQQKHEYERKIKIKTSSLRDLKVSSLS